MKFFRRYALYVILMILMLLAAFMYLGRHRVVEIDTGFKYDKQQELDGLIKKAKKEGLSKSEFNRLNKLLEDQHQQSERALKDYLNKDKNSSGSN